MGRLDNFLNLYGFCRNTALVGLIDAALLGGSHWFFGAPRENLFWATAAFVVSIGMSLRYLKFYRLFSVETFTSFAYSKEAKGDMK